MVDLLSAKLVVVGVWVHACICVLVIPSVYLHICSWGWCDVHHLHHYWDILILRQVGFGACLLLSVFHPQVLWPYLLEFIVPVEYTNAMSIVCRCVSAIASKKRSEEDEDYELNFEELGTIAFLLL